MFEERTVVGLYVGYLGPAGSNSYLACKEIFDPINGGHDFLFVSYDSLSKLIKAFSENRLNYAVLPALSSSEGIIKLTVDSLLKDTFNIYASGKRIIGSVRIPITFALLRKKNHSVKLKELQSIFVAFQQCDAYLHKNYPKLKKHYVDSTSKAAKNAARDEGVGAIAPDICAELYNLEVTLNNLQGTVPNYTKFYIVGDPALNTNPDTHNRILLSIRSSTRNLSVFLNTLLEYGFGIYEIYSRIENPSDWTCTYVFEIDGNDRDLRFNHLALTLNQYKIRWKYLGGYQADIESLRIGLQGAIPLRQPVSLDRSEIEVAGVKDFTVFLHEPVKTVQDVLNHLLIPPDSIVKTIAYNKEDNIFFVSVPGNKEVDENKLEAILGFPPILANEVKITTAGMEIGALSPLSAISHFQIIDNKVFEKEHIYCGYKKNNVSVKLKSEELKKVPKLTIADIATDD